MLTPYTAREHSHYLLAVEGYGLTAKLSSQLGRNWYRMEREQSRSVDWNVSIHHSLQNPIDQNLTSFMSSLWFTVIFCPLAWS